MFILNVVGNGREKTANHAQECCFASPILALDLEPMPLGQLKTDTLKKHSVTSLGAQVLCFEERRTLTQGGTPDKKEPSPGSEQEQQSTATKGGSKKGAFAEFNPSKGLSFEEDLCFAAWVAHSIGFGARGLHNGAPAVEFCAGHVPHLLWR